jgi:MFS family permease
MPLPDRSDRAVTRTIFLTLLLVNIGMMSMIPVFPSLARQIGLSEIQSGAIITLAAFFLAFLSPYWGNLSERWGRKPVMLLGLAGFSLGFLLFALVVQAGLARWFSVPATLALLLGTRAMAAALFAGVQPAAQAYIADVSTPETRTSSLALIGIAGGMGVVVGPALGGLLSGIYLNLPLYLSSLCGALGFLIIARGLPSSAPKRAEAASAPKLSPFDGRILTYLAATFIVAIAISSLQITSGFYFQDLLGLAPKPAAASVGGALFGTGLALLFSQIVLVRRFKLGVPLLLRLGFPLVALGFAILLIANSLPALVAAFIVMGLGFGMVMPGYTAAASLSVAPHEQGAVAGLTSAAMGVGSMVGPLLGTTLYSLAPQAPYAAAILLIMAISAVFWRHSKLDRLQPGLQAS